MLLPSRWQKSPTFPPSWLLMVEFCLSDVWSWTIVMIQLWILNTYFLNQFYSYIALLVHGIISYCILYSSREDFLKQINSIEWLWRFGCQLRNRRTLKKKRITMVRSSARGVVSVTKPYCISLFMTTISLPSTKTLRIYGRIKIMSCTCSRKVMLGTVG